MTDLQELLDQIGPDAKIISVETDEHDGTPEACCEICRNYIIPAYDSARRHDGIFLVPVARIIFLADGYAPGGEVLSEHGDEWPVTCGSCASEARSLCVGPVKARQLLADSEVA